MKQFLQIAIITFIWLTFSAQLCTKEIVHGKDYYTQPMSASFSTNQETALEALNKALTKYGYEILNTDESKGRITTGWRPVEVDSHYLYIFGNKDYGVSDGAYYQLIVDLFQEGPKIKVSVSTTVKTIVGQLKSSGKVEKRILNQLADYLRSPLIKMTNVGVENK